MRAITGPRGSGKTFELFNEIYDYLCEKNIFHDGSVIVVLSKIDTFNAYREYYPEKSALIDFYAKQGILIFCKFSYLDRILDGRRTSKVFIDDLDCYFSCKGIKDVTVSMTASSKNLNFKK